MVNLKINLTYSVFNRAKARNLTCIIKGETRFGFLLGYLSLSLSLSLVPFGLWFNDEC